MKKYSAVYKIENVITKQVYIGQTSDISKRWFFHKNTLRRNKNSNKHLQQSWNEYGENNFSFEVLSYCETKEERFEKETYWFNYYSQTIGEDNIFNIGHTGNAHNTKEELRKWQSEYHKTHPNKGMFKKGTIFSEEYRRKLSLASTKRKKIAQYDAYGNLIKIYNGLIDAEKETGVLSQNIGRCCRLVSIKAGKFIWRYVVDTVPTKIIVEQKTTNIILNKEHFNSGKKASEETRKKLSKSHLGKSPLIKKVDQFDLNGIFIKTWDSFSSIKNHFNKSVAHVISCCRNRRKTALGFKWAYHN